MPDNDGVSSYVILSDTLDQWRMKTNEWLSMNDPSGSSRSIKTNATTNSTSNTTGAITTAGGMGLGSSATIGENLTLFGGTNLKGTFNIDDVDIDGAVQIDGAVTVGVDGTGYDVKFFGDTSGQYMLWDQSADELVLPGDTKLSFHDAAGGENIIASADGHLEINAETTLDITAPTVDINASTTLNVDGATQLTGDVTVGVNGTGHDVQFFGATAGQHLLWDQSADELALVGDTKLSFHDAGGGENIVATSDGHLEINSGTTLDITAPTVDINASTALNVDGATQLTGDVTVGVDDTGYDVKFFGATASAFMLWDASADDLILSGAAALSVDNTTDATNTTSGSIHTDGGVGIAKKLYVGTDLDVNGATTLDAVDIDDAVQIDATFTSGVDGQGYDTKFFGDTASAFWLWDTSEDDLVFSGVAAISIDNTTDSSSTTTGSFHTDGGVGIAKKLYVGTDLDVNGATTLDAVDIDGATQIDATLTVGVDSTGFDVKFFGATSGKSWLFDESGNINVIGEGGDDLIVLNSTDGAPGADEGDNIILDAFIASGGYMSLENRQGTGDSGYSASQGGGGVILNSTDGAPGADAGDQIITEDFVLEIGISGITAVSDLQQTGTITVGVDDTGHNVKFFGATSEKYWLFDESADRVIAVSDLQQTGTLTVGVDGTGHDVKFFGATAGQHLLWDQSADELALVGDTKLSFHDAAGGENIVASTNGHLEINAGTTIDITAPTVDVNVSTTLNVDGATQLTGAVTVGVDDTGHDVQFFGATSGQHLLWDESADELALVGDTKLSFHDAAGGENIVASADGHLEINSATTLDITAPTVDINVSTVLNVDGATQLTGDVTVGVDNTGHDVKFFGATAGAYFEWAQKVFAELELRGGAAAPGKLLLSTAEATVVDGNKLGQIDFQAPAETGTDAIVVGATILAEADATFSATVNSTDLVFLTADSGAATEKVRIDSTGQVTFADGAIDVNIASHISHDHAYGTSNGLKLGGTLVTASAAELNNIVNEIDLAKVTAFALVFAA